MDRMRAAWGDDAEAVAAGVEALFGQHPERGGQEREQAAFAVIDAVRDKIPRGPLKVEITYIDPDGNATVPEVSEVEDGELEIPLAFGDPPEAAGRFRLVFPDAKPKPEPDDGAMQL